MHSARYAATKKQPDNSPDEKNNAKLLSKLKGRAAHHRAARFRCVIALAQAGQYSHPKIFNGTCEGRIEEAARGENGFGYDPLFVPEGHEQTFGELGDSVKNQLSHRSAALRQLKNWLATH